MDLTDKKTIKHLLKFYNIWSKKSLGQNFLIDKNVLEKIIKVADLSKKDTVLEIGPGLGVLTCELCQKAGNVTAVEKDEKLVEVLKRTCKDFKNLKIIKGDVLPATSYQLPADNYKIVANLPYNITAPVIRKFLESENKPKLMILLVQKEVAEKITSLPPGMNILACAVQFYGRPKMIDYVSAESFWPKPKVDSAILKITNIKPQLPEVSDSKTFFRIIKAGFSARRKKLKNSLAGGLHLPKEKAEDYIKKAKIDSNSRAEELSLANWQSLYKQIVNQ
jgi:16S rRNA (adenine1518-N6/adenine1519-N6)-dimethyltransferase